MTFIILTRTPIHFYYFDLSPHQVYSTISINTCLGKHTDCCILQFWPPWKETEQQHRLSLFLDTHHFYRSNQQDSSEPHHCLEQNNRSGEKDTVWWHQDIQQHPTYQFHSVDEKYTRVMSDTQPMKQRVNLHSHMYKHLTVNCKHTWQI